MCLSLTGVTLIAALQLIGPIQMLKNSINTQKNQTQKVVLSLAAIAPLWLLTPILTRKVVWVGYGSTVLLNLLVNVQFHHRINFVIGQLHNLVISLYTQWIFRGLKVFHGLFVHYFKMIKGLELISTAELAFHSQFAAPFALNERLELPIWRPSKYKTGNNNEVQNMFTYV